MQIRSRMSLLNRGRQRKIDEEDAEDELRKSKPTKSDDDDEPMPTSKKPGKPSRSKAPAKPVYPSRLLLNIVVTLMLLVFGGVVGAIFFEVNIAKELGFSEGKRPKVIIPIKGATDKDDPKAKELKEEINKKEAIRFEGTWVVESPDDLKGKKYIFADGNVAMPGGESGSFSVDAAQNPKSIDLPGTGKTSIAHGIYVLDGDTLRLCIAIPKKQSKKGKEFTTFGSRPKKFDAAEGTLVVLTRKRKPSRPILLTPRKTLKTRTARTGRKSRWGKKVRRLKRYIGAHDCATPTRCISEGLPCLRSGFVHQVDAP